MLFGKKKKINAYLAAKDGVFSTFDCVLSDYLSGNLKLQLTEMGLSKIEIYIDWLEHCRMVNIQGVYEKYYVDVQLDAEELAIGIDEDESDCNEFFTYNKEGDAYVIYNLIKESLKRKSSNRKKLFVPCTEKNGSAYYEFQYCKKDLPIKQLVKSGYGYWLSDSLLVHIDNDKAFFEYYSTYLEPTNAPDGTSVFCYFGVNYYTKEQTENILSRMKVDKPKNCDVLIAWLEKAVNEYNGFYLLGI